MAEVIRENIGNLHDKLIINVSKELYMPSVEKSLKEYAKKATIPGFRKGMVPTGMIRKMYGQSTLYDEVTRKASYLLEEYLKKENLSIFGSPMVLPRNQPLPLDINKPVDVEFEFEIGLKPEFDIASVISAATINRYTIIVDDKLIDNEIERLKIQHGVKEYKEIISDKDDYVYLNTKLEGEVESEHETDDQNNPEEADVEIELSKLPIKIQEILMGKTKGETLLFIPGEVTSESELDAFLADTLKMSDDKSNENIEIKIVNIASVKPLEMGEELFTKVYNNPEIADETSFREQLQKELTAEFNRITNERLQNEIFELLVHNTNISLPIPFLKRWLMEGGENVKTVEEVENEFGSFEHQLRWQLITDKIIIENKLNVSREEVEETVKAQVLNYFGIGNAESKAWLDSYVDKVMKDKKMLEETYLNIMSQKIFVFLETQFKFKDTVIEEAEFFKLQNAHAAHHHH